MTHVSVGVRWKSGAVLGGSGGSGQADFAEERSLFAEVWERMVTQVEALFVDPLLT